ncbi:copia protein [Tanacetum coccineum]
MNIIVNSSVDNTYVNVRECKTCLKLETELLNKKDFIEKEIYDNLFRSFTTLEKHCISLEVDTQLNQEIFQRDNSVSNKSAPSFDQYFELNELKAQSQEKDTVIKKLKERIKSLIKFGNDHVAKILGYGDYHISNVMISRVYYVEGLGHNLFSIGQFCYSNLKVAFCQHTCFIRNLEDAVATGMLHPNVRSYVIITAKTPYEAFTLQISQTYIFYVFWGHSSYLKNDSENLCKLQSKADTADSNGSEHSSSGLALHEMTPATISSGLMPNPPPLSPKPFLKLFSLDVISTIVLTAASNSDTRIFEKYGMESSDPVDTPMVEKSKLDEDTQGKAVDPTHYHEIVSTLMYLTATRPDLIFDVCMCARVFANRLDEVHLDVCNYWEKGLLAGHQKGKKTMRSQLTDYGLGFNKILMYYDNKSAIALCCNNVQYSRSKHIDIRFHFIKEQVEKRIVGAVLVIRSIQICGHLHLKPLAAKERIEFRDHSWEGGARRTLKLLEMKKNSGGVYLKRYLKEQQQALDAALVPRSTRLRIGNYNYILSTTFKPKEPTFQVALDVLSLTPFLSSLLDHCKVSLAIYMHEYGLLSALHFPNHLGRNFVDPPFEEEILAFIRELDYSGNVKSLSDVKVVPKPKYVRRSTREKTDQALKASPGKRLKATAKVDTSGKKKLPAQDLIEFIEIALSEAAKNEDLSPKETRKQFHCSHTVISWKSNDGDAYDEVSESKDDDDNVDNEDDDGQDDDNEQTESDNDCEDFVHPKFSLR